MKLRERLLGGLARQLGHPTGVRGRVVVRLLNRRNRNTIEAAARAALAATPEDGPGTYADVGFGGGVGLELLLDGRPSGATIVGVEISETMLARARGDFANAVRSGDLRIERGSLSELPFEDASVAGLISVNTVYFVEDLGPVWIEIARVLAPGGVAAIGVGDPDRMAEMPFTEDRFTLRPLEELESGARAAGLEPRGRESVNAGSAMAHVLSLSRPPVRSDAG